MKKRFSFIRNTSFVLLSALATLANITAQIGCGTASSWGQYQPTLPDELTR